MTKINNYLYRGPRPASMDMLNAYDFKVALNLERGWFEDFHSDLYEGQKNKYFPTLIRKDFPLSDFSSPSVGELIFLAKFINEKIKLEIKIYVHCLHGNDRTGMVIAAYRILYCGFTISEAKAEMYSLGFHKFPYFYWVNQLEKLK